jgi:SNF2 family DNA or RNA helicase
LFPVALHRDGDATNEEYYKHVLRWNETVKKGSVIKASYQETKLSDMLALSVNTGRAAAPQPAGLAVAARPFQLQTISFMQEIEQEGSNKGLWAEFKTAFGESIFYSASLNKIRHRAPDPIRGGILASEMGLGKTVMALGLCLSNPAPNPLPAILAPVKKASKATLVVCAVSLVGQWVEEAKSKLSDSNVNIYAYHGGNRNKDPNFLASQDIVVTTYSVLTSDTVYWAKKSLSGNYVAPLESVLWHRIILDESHTIKSSNTGQTKAVMKLKATNKWCMSGTPFCTSAEDIVEQLKFVGLGCIPEKQNNFKYSRYNQSCGPLYDFAAPLFMIRHVQTQKIDGASILELPSKTEIVKKVKLGGTERTVYRELHKRAFDKFKMIPDGMISSKTLEILSYLLPLRKACSGGVLRLDESVTEPQVVCPICEDVCEDPVMTKCKHVFCKTCITSLIESNTGIEPCPVCEKDLKMTDVSEATGDFAKANDVKVKGGGGAKAGAAAAGGGAATAPTPAPSAKMVAAFEATKFRAKLKVLLTDLRQIRKDSKKAKVLIFSQFNETLDRLKTGLTEKGYQYRTLTGSMTRAQRSKALSDFQQDPPTTVFLLSTRAGAVGINLTQANHVFLMEPSFNQALEKQAIGRVYRMGQTRKVHVTRFVIENSIEENMLTARTAQPEDAGLTGVGSLNREGKTAAGAMDFVALFGSADDMPPAGSDDDVEEDEDEGEDEDTTIDAEDAHVPKQSSGGGAATARPKRKARKVQKPGISDFEEEEEGADSASDQNDEDENMDFSGDDGYVVPGCPTHTHHMKAWLTVPKQSGGGGAAVAAAKLKVTVPKRKARKVDVSDTEDEEVDVEEGAEVDDAGPASGRKVKSTKIEATSTLISPRRPRTVKEEVLALTERREVQGHLQYLAQCKTGSTRWFRVVELRKHIPANEGGSSMDDMVRALDLQLDKPATEHKTPSLSKVMDKAAKAKAAGNAGTPAIATPALEGNRLFRSARKATSFIFGDDDENGEDTE